MTRAEYIREWRRSPKGRESNRKKAAAYRAANREKMRELDRARYLTRKAQILAANERRRARRFAAEGSHTFVEWQRLCELSAGCCAYCGSEGPLTKDHFIPLSLGGTEYIDNIVPACRSCNCSKSAKSPEQFANWMVNRILQRRV
jgi:5-methylcytosine-specific restriction endonuclease McrA